MNIQEIIFTEDGSKFCCTIKKIIDNLEQKEYKFMPDDEFNSLLKQDFLEAHKVYWQEILYRAHFVSVSSLVRNFEWVRSMQDAYKNKNLYGFCSSFRSFIEAAGDTSYSITKAPKLLSENFNGISQALKKDNSQQSFLGSQELEDTLIHYIYGRKLKKAEKSELPLSHNAEQPFEYYGQVKNFTNFKNVGECYSELCQYTHPAAHSVFHMFAPDIDDKGTINNSSIRHFKPYTSEIILNSIVKKYSLNQLDLLSIAFNPALITLKILKEMPFKNCHNSYIDQVNLDDIGLWKECNDLMNKH